MITSKHKYIRMLSVNNDILMFKCQHSSPKSMDHQRGSEIAFAWLALNKELKLFSNKHDQISPLYKHSSKEVDVVYCASALDVKKRRTVPYILLRLCKKKESSFKYMLYSLSTTSKAELHVDFVLTYEMKDNINILQGPTLVWSHNHTVFYTSSQAGGIREVPIHLNINFIGQLPTLKRKLVILGSRHSPDPYDKSYSHGQYKNLLYFIEDGKMLSGSCVIPDVYSPVIQCIFVVCAKEVSDSLQSTVVVATNRKQLVCFENGLSKAFCQLPYDDAQCIQLVHTGSSGNLFCITFSHGNACAVWQDTFQVASSWTGVSSLLVDDFIGCGTDQMLLVFENQDDQEDHLSNFILTDLCGTTITPGQPHSSPLKTSEAVHENHLLTVQALESRLQSGLSLLHELQNDMEVKERVLQQSVRALTDLLSGTEHALSSPEQEGLVSMLDDGDVEETGTFEEKMQTGPEMPALQVERVWQRIIGDRLIFGALLTASCPVSLDSLSVSILTEAGVSPAPAAVATRCRAQRLEPEPAPPSPAQPEPPTKRSRLPPRLSLTAVTELAPLLTSARVKCPVMLHYAAAARPQAPLIFQCGHVCLHIEDITQGKFSPRLLTNCKTVSDEAREDLLGLLAGLDSWRFRIACADHAVADVAGWLRGGVRCRRLEVSPGYLLAGPAGPAATGTGPLLRWQPSSPFQGLLHVHCSGQLVLLQFLDSLCGFLPVSHTIQLVRQQGPDSSTAHALAQTLDTELCTLKEEAISLLHAREEEAEGERDLGGGDTDEQLRRRREEWEKDRERSNRRWRTLVDTERYRRLRLSLLKAQLDGDLAALSETQRGSSSL